MTTALAVADQHEPRFRRTWQAALAVATARRIVPALATAMAGGTPADVIGAIPWLSWQADLVDGLLPAYALVLTASGQAASRTLVAKADFNFTPANPRATQWALTHSATLVRDVTEETRGAIRNLVGQMFARGIPPAEAAKIIQQHIGLTQRDSGALWRFQLALQDQFAAGKIDATTLTTRVQNYRAQLLANRATMIARTEAMTASNQGQMEAWKQAQAIGLLGDDAKRQWLVTPDERLCPICAPVPQRGPVGLQQPFTLGDNSQIMVPPAHPQCRCTISLVLA